MGSPAEIFGKYELLERIDVGGMAEVYYARLSGADGFERTVAIKRILPDYANDETFVKMFIDEAKIAARLSHPNIAQIFDLGRDGDHLFIALEYVHGKDLRALWNYHKASRTPIPIALSCYVVLKAAEALHHAHFAEGAGGKSLGLIHRDVSPQNILVSYEGEVKVIDFGLAKAHGRAVQTAKGLVKGKLAYMSPEQAKGAPIDSRSDVFALGIVFWELLTGERLYFSPNDVETITRAQRGEVQTPRKFRPEITEDLERVVGLAMQRDLDDRYQSAMEMYDDLNAFVMSSGLRLTAEQAGEHMRRAFPDGFAKHRPIAPEAVVKKKPAPIQAPPARAIVVMPDPTTIPEAIPAFEDVTTTERKGDPATVQEHVDGDTTIRIAPPGEDEDV